MSKWKPRKFRLHFNRVNMQRGNPKIWTVHTSKCCYQVKQVKVYVPLETVFNPDGPQPRAYLAGRAEVYVHKNIAYLLDARWSALMSDNDYFEAINGLPR